MEALPWGADALGIRDAAGDEPGRPVDLLRVGRQPPAWEDDEATARAARELGVAFAGRPGFGSSPEDSALLLGRAEEQAKFVLAFSNAVAPAAYTHPRREYLTGRWFDALAHGAGVLGRLPRTELAQRLLWEGACREIAVDSAARGLEQVRAFVASWSPQEAARNRSLACRYLDWRHRFAQLLAAAELTSPALDRDLARIRTLDQEAS